MALFDATDAEFCSLVTADHERQENLPAQTLFGPGISPRELGAETGPGQLTIEAAKASLLLFPAQNISVYTISLANVSVSLDATLASKCCRSEVCEFVASWLEGCCKAHGVVLTNDKNCHSSERRNRTRKQKQGELGTQYEDHCQHSS